MSWANHYIGRTDLHCWALVVDVYAQCCGITLPAYGEVDAKQMQGVADAVAAAAPSYPWHPVKPFPGGEQLFDVVVMKGWLPTGDGVVRRGVIHTGVVSRRGHVLHTDMGDAVVEVLLSHATVRRRLVGCYRHAAYVGV